MLSLVRRNASRRNLPAEDLRQMALRAGEVRQAANGSVVLYTGEYTGRSPGDRFIVATPAIRDKIDWGNINLPVSPETFDRFLDQTLRYLSNRNAYVFDGRTGVEGQGELRLRIIAEHAYETLFAEYMFVRDDTPVDLFDPELTVLVAPGCRVPASGDGPQAAVFILINFEKKIVLIGGTAYCGEIKKAVFSFLNFLLPDLDILPMHCAATVGHDGGAALYFGLSGTGKTTLSSDPERRLIGDDEHGWGQTGIFNFENGCYAKCIHLDPVGEPYIWKAIEQGALLENVVLGPEDIPDFNNDRWTENTRAAYPLKYSLLAEPSRQTGHPRAVIFLTADAFGVLPPVARLNLNGALYHFLSGYTSKLAGTECGVKEPTATFSTCFGAPFMPRPAIRYAELLRQRLEETHSEVFLLNTGWCRGPYGVGSRFRLADTRIILDAILSGALSRGAFRHDPLFNLEVPLVVPRLDPLLLDPAALWTDRNKYDAQAKMLVEKFVANARTLTGVPPEILAAGPRKG